MKSSYRFILATAGLLFAAGCSSEGSPPSAEEVEPALKHYLIMEKAKTCGGTVTVDRLSILKVGEFESKLDGFPVYATFGVSCVEGSGFSNWNSDDTSTTNFTTVVRRKMSGEIECFMPDLFKERQNAMQRQQNTLPQDVMKTEPPKPIGVGR
jgi:hypothetical protein